MGKLKLVANPSFKAKVPIPVAGGKSVDVEFTFRHRTKKELLEWSASFVKSQGEKADTESFLEMVTAWELEDEFNAENVTLLLENYGGAGLATYQKYVNELTSAKLGNSAR